MCVFFQRIKTTSTLECHNHVSHTIQHFGGRSLAQRQDRVRVGIVERTPSVFSTRTETCALLLWGHATVIANIARQVQGRTARRVTDHDRSDKVVWERRWDLGLGRSDGRRGERQTSVGSIHQTFTSSEHHGDLLVSRHVSARKICQDHQSSSALHRGLQEPSR